MAHTPNGSSDAGFGSEDWRPARETRSQQAWRPGMKKKRRSIQALFASSVLCLEAIVLFFLGMTIFGLNRAEDHAVWFIVGYSLLAVFVAVFLGIMRIVHSPYGQVLKAIRENEPRAISLGYDVDRYKLLAFVLSAAIAGLAGAIKTLVLGFAMVWYIWWLAALSFVALLAYAIAHTFNYDRDTSIPVEEVVRTEGERTRLLGEGV